MGARRQPTATILAGLIVVMVLGIGTTVYHLVSIRRLDDTVRETQYQLLDSIRRAVDTKMRSVDNALLGLAFNEYMTAFMEPSSRGEFETLENLQGVQRQLFGIRSINEGISSVWAISFARDQVLTDTSSTTLNTLSDREWVASIAFDPGAFRFVERRIQTHPRAIDPPETSTVVSIARPYPVLSSGPPYQRGLLVASIDLGHLARLCSIETDEPGLFVVVTDRTGEVVLASPGAAIGLESPEVSTSALTLGQVTPSRTTVEGEDVEMIHQVSTFNDWVYSLVMPVSYLRARTQIITTTQVLVLALLCIAGVILSAALMRWSFAPVNRFVDSVHSRLTGVAGAAASGAGASGEAPAPPDRADCVAPADTPQVAPDDRPAAAAHPRSKNAAGEAHVGRRSIFADNGGGEDDFARIESAVARVLTDNASMRKQIAERAPVVRWSMLADLLMGGTRSMPWDKQRAALQELGVELYDGAFLVVALVSDTDPTPGALGRIGEMASEIALNVGRGVATEMWNRRVALIISFRDPPEDAILHAFALAQELQQRVADAEGVSLSVGISSLHPEPEGIPTAYREALQALNHRVVLGPGSITAYEEVEASFEPDVAVLYADVERVLRTVLGSGSDSVGPTVREWFARAVERGAEVATIRRLGLHLLMAATGRAAEAGVETGTVATQLSPDSVSAIVEDVVGRLCDLADRFRESKGSGRARHVVEQAKEIVSRTFADPLLSLNSVAEEVGMSSGHLSRLFHEFSGVRFVDFVINTRIDRAKQLLCEDLSVQTVGERVGYVNTHSFLRIFKRSTGLTPSEYRRTRTAADRDRKGPSR